MEIYIQAEELRAWGIEVKVEVVAVSDAFEQLNKVDSFIKQGIDGIAIAQVYDSAVSKKLDELMANGIPVYQLRL